jgi:hypothetical protein
MPSYLVETYARRADTAAQSARERRARSAAEELTLEGWSVRFDRSIHVPEDEICFFVFEAPSSREVVLAAARGALEAIRVVEAILSGEEAPS